MPSKKKSKSRGKSKQEKIRVALIGVGNVASVLVQALHSGKKLEGTWHPSIGGYSIKDIELVAAFDIDRSKVGLDLSEAIFAKPNVSPKFVGVQPTGIVVRPGLVGSDVPAHLKESTIQSSPISEALRDSKAEIALLLIPSGMQETCAAYAEEALKAGVGLINATPAVLATDQRLSKRFERSKLSWWETTS